jgi:SpoVK/Ycf46/Vps4 family AAA+-type ATPase
MKATQWASMDNGYYAPCTGTLKILPAGKYEIEIGMGGKVFYKPLQIITDDLIEVKDSLASKILKDIDIFWTRGAIFARYGLLHRRGYLLWGSQGTGKTCLLIQITQRFIAMNGIVFDGSCPHDLSRGLKEFRKVEPDRPLICIFEDIDDIVENQSEGDVLSLLDGEDQINKVVNIATTNYPENLPPRLLKRPRRFDRIYEIGNPDEAQRKAYFLAKLQPQDLQPYSINKWVEATEGFSFAGLTDLIISVICLGNGFEESLEAIKNVLAGSKSPTLP